MKKQLFSFFWAIRGIWSAIKTEGHLRFHLVTAFYVLLFSAFYNFSAERLALLAALIAAVIAAELFNTALEKMCDRVTNEKDSLIRVAKDVSAGAVLVLCVAAAAVAALFFADVNVIRKIFGFFAENILMLIPLALSAAAAVAFVWLGPLGIKKLFVKTKADKGHS